MDEMDEEKSRDQVAETIAGFVHQNAPDVGDGAADNDSLEHLDSLEMLQLIAFIESTFGILVDDSDVRPEHFETVRAVAGYIDGKRRSEVCKD
jgi:acyl carrier protein